MEVPARSAPREGRAGSTEWPSVIGELVAAAADGPQALVDTGLRVARRLTAADGATLVRWSEGRAQVVARQGDGVEQLERRPAEGAGRLAKRPVAVASVDTRNDLIVSRRRGPDFEEVDVEILEAVAALLRRPVAVAGDTLHQLQEVAARLLTSSGVDEVAAPVAEAISRLMRAEVAGVFLREASGEELVMRRAVGNRTVETARLRIRPGQGLAGRVLATGRPERIDDYATDPRIGKEFLAVAEAEGTCSAVCVPLTWEASTIGVLAAWRLRRTPFTEEDETLLVKLADLTAAAVHNAQRHDDDRAHTERLEKAHRALEERYEAAERELRVHAELTRIAVDGDDLAAIPRMLRTLTGGSAAVVADDGRVLATCEGAPGENLPARLAAWQRRAGAGVAGVSCVVEEEGRSWMVVAPVRAAGTTFGHLGLGLAAPPALADTVAAEQAGVVSALLLAREEAAVSASRRLASEFVWDLLEGRLSDEAEALVRARHLGSGFQLPARVAVVAVAGLSARATSEGWTPDELERARGQVGRTLRDHLELAGARDVVLARRADQFALVVPRRRGESAEAAQRFGKILAEATHPSGLSWTVGVGGLVETMSGFPEGWRQAQLALSAAASPVSPGVFEDLGVLQFLLAPASRNDLDAFARRLLGPLIAYDEEHGTALVATLEAYVDSDWSTRRAAERMGVHHKTVCYRLQRAEDLTTLALDRHEDRFHAQLALKILGLTQDPALPQPPVDTKASK